MVKQKISQIIMVWFLPLIVIGGLFFPLIGLLVLVMMLLLLSTAYFKGRFWCANFCPRGAFFDLVLAKLSLKNKIPKVFTNSKFRNFILVLFMVFFIVQMVNAKNIYGVGVVFVRMCLVTTIIAIILGIPLHQRTWCAFCPMGNLQEKIYKLGKEKK